MPARTRNPDPPALLDEGPQLHLDQDLLGNQAVLDLGLGGSRGPKPGLLDFDNPNPRLDRRPVSIGPVEDDPMPAFDWRTTPETEPERPAPTAPEPARGVDTGAPTILPAGRPKKF